MAHKRRSELAAGVFVIAALVLTFGVVVWLGPGLLAGTRQRAVFYADSAAGSLGLQVGSFAQINDREIGQVAEIVWDPAAGRTLYYIDIRQDGVAIRADAKATVVSGLIGGTKLVLTDLGSSDKPLADAKNPIVLSGGLDQAMSDLADTARSLRTMADILKAQLQPDQANAVLAKVHALLDDLRKAGTDVAAIAAGIRKEFQAESGTLLSKVHRSVDDINNITADVARETDAKEKDSLLAKAHRSVDDVNAMTADARPKLERTMTAVAETAEKFRDYTRKDIADILAQLREANTEILKISKNFSAVSEQARQIVTLNRDNVDEMIDNLTQVSVNLKSVSKEVRRNPWKLLYEPKKDELNSQNIYDAARAFSSGASDLDQAIAKLKAVDPASADSETLQKIQKHLEETFTKFSEAEDRFWKEMQK